MAYVEMSLSPVYGRKTDLVYEYSYTLTAVAAGAWIIIPRGISIVTLTLKVASGAGKISTTTDLLSNVLAGTALAVDWDFGAIAATKTASLDPVTAIRAELTSSGSITLSLRAQ